MCWWRETSHGGDEVSGERVRRRRRKPEEAERVILAAGRAFLEEHPFREMTVEGIMVRTGLSRPAFYAYFKDRYDLITRLLEGVGGLLFALDWRWLSGTSDGSDAGSTAKPWFCDVISILPVSSSFTG